MLHTCCKCFITKLNHNFVINKFTFDSTPIISLANIFAIYVLTIIALTINHSSSKPKERKFYFRINDGRSLSFLKNCL